MTGNTALIKKLYPHLDDEGITEKLVLFQKDRMEQAKRDVEANNYLADNLTDVTMMGGTPEKEEAATPGKPRIADRAKHSRESSVQPGKNGDTRKTDKARRRDEQK
jgi:hypothetical protein